MMRHAGIAALTLAGALSLTSVGLRTQTPAPGSSAQVATQCSSLLFAGESEVPARLGRLEKTAQLWGSSDEPKK